MKFAIIGTGFIFQKHIDAIRSIGGEITEAINKDSFLNYKDIINWTKAKFVVILTPNYLHAEMVEYAAKKGKIVLCEKPLAITPADIERLSKYKNVFVVLQLRHHPQLKEMRKAIKKSDNKIKLDIAVYRDREYYKSWKGDDDFSGGIIFNLGIHYIDLALYLLKDKQAKLYIKLRSNEKKEKIRRIIEINGKRFNLSSKENLAEENLHRFVYQDLIKGKGVRPNELKELTNIIFQWKPKQRKKCH